MHSRHKSELAMVEAGEEQISKVEEEIHIEVEEATHQAQVEEVETHQAQVQEVTIKNNSKSPRKPKV